MNHNRLAKGMSDLIDGLIPSIFEAEERRLKKFELNMVRENSKAHGTKDGQSLDGFFYQGFYYTDLALNLQSKGVKGALHPSLAPAMDSHINDKREVQFDRIRVKQALAVVLRGAHDHQDIRDALPNSLGELIDQCRSLKRSRPEAFTLENDERALRQYLKLRDKIEFYMAARLLY